MTQIIHFDLPKPDRSVSYWQLGCNDGKAGREKSYPSKDGPFANENYGYDNGYRWGAALALLEAEE